jgi:hypothetical protein
LSNESNNLARKYTAVVFFEFVQACAELEVVVVAVVVVFVVLCVGKKFVVVIG